VTAPSGKLDNAIRIVTPENIAFEYRVAGPFRRLLAYALDMLVRFAVLFVLSFIVDALYGVLAGVGEGAQLIAYFVMEWFYGGLFEALWNGQTPGKRVCGLRVLTAEGLPINAWQAILRNVLRAVDAMPIYIWRLPDERFIYIPTYQLGLFACLMNDRFQRMGDLACNTMVVVEQRSTVYGVRRIDEPEALRLAAQLPAKLDVSRSLARALSLYVERRKRFGAQRRAEIAWYLAEPLREKLGLPVGTHPDTLLCALYQRTFIGGEAPPQALPEVPQHLAEIILNTGRPAPVDLDAVLPEFERT
jgi:uncharacterized RDD family membrane protein YckC